MFGGSDWDSAKSIQQTSDGGYIVAGSSDSIDIFGLKNNGKTDFYIIKLDEKGEIQWQRMYGGNADDVAHSIQQTNDGGYIIVGYSESEDISGIKNSGNGDIYILKLDQNGDL